VDLSPFWWNTYHVPIIIMLSFQYPGPNEAGLKYYRDHTQLYPLTEKAWLGPLLPLVAIRHYTVMKALFQSSGNISTFAFVELYLHFITKITCPVLPFS